MKIISDIIAALRANMQCLWLKVFSAESNALSSLH